MICVVIWDAWSEDCLVVKDVIDWVLCFALASCVFALASELNMPDVLISRAFAKEV